MQPWFEPQTAGWIGGIFGSVMGLTGAFIGCSCGLCVRKGWKRFMLTLFAIAIGISVLLLIAGLAALLSKQPFHVWYLFLLPGLIGTIVFSGLLPVILRRFTEKELRQIQANDL